MASLSCKDIRIDCLFEAQGITEHELMRKYIEHSESVHKVQVLSAEDIFKVQNAIKK